MSLSVSLSKLRRLSSGATLFEVGEDQLEKEDTEAITYLAVSLDILYY